ncbi:MAG: hypothetical protein WAL29_03185 [Bacteroidales bacterium]
MKAKRQKFKMQNKKATQIFKINPGNLVLSGVDGTPSPDRERF